MKYEAIRACSREFSVVKMCKAIGLRASNYYRWMKNQEKKEEKEREERELAAKVREVFIRNKRLYGYRKMQRALEKEGLVLSEYKVRQVMRRTGLYPVSMRKYRPGRSRSIEKPYAENELHQDFHAEEPGKVLTGDITYIRTNLGWAYLAAVMDLYNREIVGYAVSRNIDTELVKRALGNAIARCGGLEGAVFHSDRGSQYNSESYKKMLKENGIRQSMSRGGTPFDNACQETYAFSAGLYESGRIQAGTLCLKTKEEVPICTCENQVSKSRRSPPGRAVPHPVLSGPGPGGYRQERRGGLRPGIHGL